MKPILQNLVEMTGHRDHLRLEVSVLSTLQKLSATTEVRALEVFTDDGATHVRPRTWVQDGDLVSTDSEAASDPQREPLNSYPALCQCIEKREIRATRPAWTRGATRCGCPCGCTTRSAPAWRSHSRAPFRPTSSM
jgi:hypothetical protein